MRSESHNNRLSGRRFPVQSLHNAGTISSSDTSTLRNLLPYLCNNFPQVTTFAFWYSMNLNVEYSCVMFESIMSDFMVFNLSFQIVDGFLGCCKLAFQIIRLQHETLFLQLQLSLSCGKAFSSSISFLIS